MALALGAAAETAAAAGSSTTPTAPATQVFDHNPFSSGSNVVTGFSAGTGTECAIGGRNGGPIGLLNNGSSFFVDDYCNQITYKLPAAGGSITSATAQAKNGLTGGLALVGGVYYGLIQNKKSPAPPPGGGNAGLYTFDPSTLAVTYVVSFPGDSTSTQDRSVIGDPSGSNLYVGTSNGIYKVSLPGHTVTRFDKCHPAKTSPPCSGSFDGLAFSNNGNILYASDPDKNSNVVEFDLSGDPTHATPILSGAKQGPDGLVVAPPVSTPNGINVAGNVFINTNDGHIQRYTGPGHVSEVARGGSRGDFATTDPQGCVYVTQAASIEELLPCLGARGDWPKFHYDLNNSGYNPYENVIGPGNVSTLTTAWTGAIGGGNGNVSPVVANGVAYIGSSNGILYAFSAAGTTNCSGSPKTCTPLWTASTGGTIDSTPAVENGVVYIGWSGTSGTTGGLDAFSASGTTNCSGTPKTCTPLWTGTTGPISYASPAVWNGFVYIGSDGGTFYAFNAAGGTNCTGSPKMCAPLWTAATENEIDAAPAVCPTCGPDGVVFIPAYIHFGPGRLFAFDALGATGPCAMAVCSPLWTAPTPNQIEQSSPAVAGGVVYVGAWDGNLYAFSATGTTGCSGTPLTCNPLWTGAIGGSTESSPAVANGVVYIGSDNRNLFAFSATASSANCKGTPKTCFPLWSGTTGSYIDSSPAVANGVVYAESGNDLYAFNAAGSTGCSGTPKTCAPLAAEADGGGTSGPAVANGVVYVGSNDLYAFTPS